MTKYYTGIGSRETPEEITAQFTLFGAALARKGMVLRSGGADGADMAFEAGCDIIGGPKEIYLPWSKFNGNPSSLFPPTLYAMEMAKLFHPAWNKCSPAAKKMHARNCHQVLGPFLDTPSEFVICWTKGGTGQGGTGQAIRIAEHYRIPVYDFGSPNMIDHVAKLIEGWA